MNAKKDPQTGELFYPKRSNQVFATRKNQSDFNNAKAKIHRGKLSPINNQLRKNWLILSKKLGEQKAVNVSKDFLLGAGYDFKFFNNYFVQENKTYYGVYEFGLQKKTETIFEIVKFNYHE